MNLVPLWWHDLSDISTLFQDALGTIPVTATGQALLRVNDKSGNGNHLTAGLSTGAIYRESGARRFMEFITAGRGLSTPGNVLFGGSSNVTIFIGIEKLSDAVSCVGFESSSASSTNPGCFALFAPFSPGGATFSGRGHSTVPPPPTVTASGFSAPQKRVITLKSYAGLPVEIRISGASFTGGNSTGALVNNRFFVGGRDSPSALVLNGNIDQAFAVNRVATAGEIADAEAFILGKIT